ncbi:uncharacterized protein LOC114526574 [Dendronephthya gigantea]|uniref:uncharacterized protein LOC114526574 n=1 Tax=Dendronephthya gigantea TaxID=151771 RepID=UPI0010696917|nr:uncharacterized protein LOC114526574 [Dendronephthya gigantea]
MAECSSDSSSDCNNLVTNLLQKTCCYKLCKFLCVAARLTDKGKRTANRPLSKKICSECGVSQPVAKRTCLECGNVFRKKIKISAEKIKKKGKTNPTDQKDMMHARARILHERHQCDIVILTHKKHGLGYTISTYGTEGLAEMFIGRTSSDRSEEGHAIVALFERFMTVQRNKQKQQQEEEQQQHIMNNSTNK